ncbi:MAG: glycosyltransferase [Phycisphaerae bacterium]
MADSSEPISVEFRPATGAAAILVSFVLATFNRGPVLVDSLRQVQNCGLPPHTFEIIAVDNASTDSTPELLERELPQVQLIRLPRNEGPVAKNHAIARARGQFVIFLDDDAFPLPGAVPRMLEYFAADPALGAAAFNVMLPDGTPECSAYPNVCIGAGTGFRKDVLDQVGYLPPEFFMQAEEYDLSFRILRAGFKVQRFEDLPLRHLKTPQARIGERTTRLDVRNNLYLLARYVPAPLCYQLAADWLSRYWMMAVDRDRRVGTGAEHRKAFMQGAAEGLAKWSARRRGCVPTKDSDMPNVHGAQHAQRGSDPAGHGTHLGSRGLLEPEVIEKIFKFHEIQIRLSVARQRLGFHRILLADFGKNIMAYYQAAQKLGLPIVAVTDDHLAGQGQRDYRGLPILPWAQARQLSFDAVIISNLSPVHARQRLLALQDVCPVPVVDLFAPTAIAGKGE